MIKVGLVGMGFIGNSHYEKYQNVSGVKVVAVAEVRDSMAKEKLGSDDVTIYPSLEVMLEKEELDAVDICTPTYMHAEMSILALSKGVHVLCEKPMALTSKDAERMIEAAKKTDKKFMIGHVVRFAPAFEYLKSVVDSKELGKPLHVEVKRVSQFPYDRWENWLGDLEKGKGAIFDMSIHDFDFARNTFGMPTKVSSVYHKMSDNNDFATTELIYDGFDVTVTGGFYKCDLPFSVSFSAVFENGYVLFSDGKIIKNGEVIDLSKVEKTREIQNLIYSCNISLQNEIQYFVDCIRNNVDPDMATPESAKQSVALVERILENCVLI